MQSGVSSLTTTLDKEKYRNGFVRMASGLAKRCQVLKESADGSFCVISFEENGNNEVVSSRHVWYESFDDASGSKCVVCFMAGLLLSCKHCGRHFHEMCSKMPLSRSATNANPPKFTCRDCFFMIYASHNGMEKPGSFRQNVFMNEVKISLTYAYRELRWDALYRSNLSSIYCYCGGPGTFSNRMVQCIRCLQWFHRACLHSLPADREILPWDFQWYFKCAYCNGQYGEVIRQIPVFWAEILHIALMNLNTNTHRFCNLKYDILLWIRKNWKHFTPAINLSEGLKSEEFITQQLRADPARFQCAREVGGSTKEWRTRCNFSGAVRSDVQSLCPVDTPISQEKLDNLPFKRVDPECLPLVTLQTAPKLPPIGNFEFIYGTRERYKKEEKRLQKSRLLDYDPNEKHHQGNYLPDEDSVSETPEALRKKMKRSKSLDSRRTVIGQHSRAKKRRLNIRQISACETTNENVSFDERPCPSNPTHSSSNISHCIKSEEILEITCEKIQPEPVKGRKRGIKSQTSQSNSPVKVDGSEKSEIIPSSPVKKRMKRMSNESDAKMVKCKKGITDVKDSEVSKENDNLVQVTGLLMTTKVDSCGFSDDSLGSHSVVKSSSSHSLDKDVDVEAPILRPRPETTPPRKKQVAKKTGRPIPLVLPSPPTKKALPVTRMCHVALKNVHNWYEITGDKPPQMFASGSHILRGIPSHISFTDKNIVPPFSYRWEMSSRQRYTRLKILNKGWPSRHATSTPFTPRMSRKKTSYDTSGVATIKARRSQHAVKRQTPILSVSKKKGESPVLTSSKKGTGDTKELPPYSNEECTSTDSDDDYKEVLLEWNLKLVRVQPIRPM